MQAGEASASLKIWYSELKLQLKGQYWTSWIHSALEISEANATPYISKSSGNSRKQKTGVARSRYPNRAVTTTKLFQTQNSHHNKTIPNFASPIKNFWLRHCNYKVHMCEHLNLQELRKPCVASMQWVKCHPMTMLHCGNNTLWQLQIKVCRYMHLQQHLHSKPFFLVFLFVGHVIQLLPVLHNFMVEQVCM